MTMRTVIVVYEDGRIYLPKSLMKRYKLVPRDYVVIEELQDGIKLIPTKSMRRKDA